MITVSINDNGELTISQETPGERIFMSRHYAEQEREASQATLDDDDRAQMFKQGWDSAIRETQLQYVNGRIEEFFSEMGQMRVDLDGSDDDRNYEPEDEHNKALWAAAKEAFDDREPEDGGPVRVVAEGVARPVTDSGEPEKEADAEAYTDHAGRWIIPADEFQAIKDAEFERGMAYTSPTVNRRITDQELEFLERKMPFSAIRGAFDRAASQTQQEIQEREDADTAELGVKGIRATSHDGTALLLRNLFVELGFEVTP